MKLYLWYIVFTEKKIVCMKISKKIPDYEHSDFVISYHSTSINETLIVCSKTKDDKKKKALQYTLKEFTLSITANVFNSDFVIIHLKIKQKQNKLDRVILIKQSLMKILITVSNNPLFSNQILIFQPVSFVPTN